MKKVLILGCDGYIGYPLTLHLLKKGYEVSGIDSNVRRERIFDIDGDSLTPISAPSMRIRHLNKFENFKGWTDPHLGKHTALYELYQALEFNQPDCIVHLAEQPSAPWSMVSPHHAMITQQDNVLGTLQLLWAMKQYAPKAHLVKIGSMGEYGTPDCDIPEGTIPEECISHVQNIGDLEYCPLEGLPFPRSPNSFYHLSKVHDTHNIIFACKTWGLTSTDIMQGVVFGLGDYTCKEELTRFDYDQYFGTAINRFCAQALSDFALTVYGKGLQQRGFLPLKDSIQCLTLAIDNPPDQGEYRVFNQFENIYSIKWLAKTIQEVGFGLKLNININNIPNPRTESDDHYFNPAHQKLLDLGYKPTENIRGEIYKLLNDLMPFKSRIDKSVIAPTTNWR